MGNAFVIQVGVLVEHDSGACEVVMSTVVNVMERDRKAGESVEVSRRVGAHKISSAEGVRKDRGTANSGVFDAVEELETRR